MRKIWGKVTPHPPTHIPHTYLPSVFVSFISWWSFPHQSNDDPMFTRLWALNLLFVSAFAGGASMKLVYLNCSRPYKPLSVSNEEGGCDEVGRGAVECQNWVRGLDGQYERERANVSKRNSHTGQMAAIAHFLCRPAAARENGFYWFLLLFTLCWSYYWVINTISMMLIIMISLS